MNNNEAVVYLKREGNEAYKIVLSERYLVVVKGKKEEKFEREILKELQINHRLLLLPIVAGGITASFSVLAIFNTFHSVFYLLVIFIASLLFFYYGIQGEMVLTIITHNLQTDISIYGASDNLKSFIKFVNHRLGHPDQLTEADFYYIIVRQHEQDLNQVLKNLNKNSPVKALEYAQFIEIKSRQNTDYKVLKIDPFKLTGSINYRRDISDNQLYPYIYGPINKEAVEEVDSFN